MPKVLEVAWPEIQVENQRLHLQNKTLRPKYIPNTASNGRTKAETPNVNPGLINPG
jgi:hypothetical protein